MKKFCVDNVEYEVERVTAIAGCDLEEGESMRQECLLVRDSGEESVVFGFDMPEDDDDIRRMCDEPSAWETDWEVLETVYVQPQDGDRREREDMPFDRNGCHGTGWEVYQDGIWWDEYEDEHGELFLAN